MRILLFFLILGYAFTDLMMGTDHWMGRVYRFYRDGFRSMTVGRTLWAVILLKLLFIFAILKLFFFPDFLGRFSDDTEREEYVRNELIERNRP